MKYAELAAAVTNRLVAMIEQGAGEWRPPWVTQPNAFDTRNASTGARYTGGNVFTLAIAAIDAGYELGWWATYKQWAELGAQVQRGQKASYVTKWVPKRQRTAGDDDGAGRDGLVPMTYAVFNSAQVDGWTPPNAGEALSDFERDERADAWIAGSGAVITHGHNHAAYLSVRDRIELPDRDRFRSSAGYYSTGCHELVHWTGHASRLNRDLSGRFGDDAYAAEELVAELGSALACTALRVAPVERQDHAAYLAHWLRILRQDPKALFAVAGRAQAAVAHLDALAGAEPIDAAPQLERVG